MKLQTLVLVVVAACVAAGCNTMQTAKNEPGKSARSIEIASPNGFDAALFTAPDRKNARVYVDEDGLLVVDQEPLRRKATDTHALIWRLDMSQPYVFPDDNAIVFAWSILNPPPAELDCGVFGVPKKVFKCTYTRTREAQWKYTIRVVNGATSVELNALDPSVHQK